VKYKNLTLRGVQSLLTLSNKAKKIKKINFKGYDLAICNVKVSKKNPHSHSSLVKKFKIDFLKIKMCINGNFGHFFDEM